MYNSVSSFFRSIPRASGPSKRLNKFTIRRGGGEKGREGPRKEERRTARKANLILVVFLTVSVHALPEEAEGGFENSSEEGPRDKRTRKKQQRKEGGGCP